MGFKAKSLPKAPCPSLRLGLDISLVSVLSVQWPPAAAGGHLTNEINYGIMTTATTSTGQEAASCLASTPRPRQQKGDLVTFCGNQASGFSAVFFFTIRWNWI